MPYFETADGSALFYSVWGSGHPTLLIHGGNIGSDVWMFQVPYLAERGHQCIVYDQRGFARSDCPSTGYDFDTLASDLDRLIRHLKLRQVSAVTFSFGAGVLARYLSRYGGSAIDRVVMIAPITPFFLKTPDNPEGLDRETTYEPFRIGMLNDRPQIFRDSMNALFRPETADHPTSHGLREWTVDAAMRSPLMPMLELFRTSSETDFRPDMKAFTMPTLIIHGDSDAFVPALSTGVRTHRMIPQSEFVLYHGASHGVLFSHYGRVNRDVAEFVEAGHGSEVLVHSF